MSSSLRMRPTWNRASEITPVEIRQARNANRPAASAPATASQTDTRSNSSGRVTARPHSTAPAISTATSGAVSGRCTAKAAASGAIQIARPSEVETTAAPDRPSPRSIRSSRIAPHPGSITQTANAHHTASASIPASRAATRTAGATSSAAGSRREDIGAGVYRRRGLTAVGEWARGAERHTPQPPVIAPLSTGASHTVLGLAGAAVGILVVWIAGCALAPARPPAERLAWGVVTMLAVAWSTLWQPLLGVSWLGHRTLMAVMVVVCTVVVAARTRAWRTAPDVHKPVVLVAAVALAVSVLPLVWGPSAVAPISDMEFHEGWIRQLVGGLPEPSGVYAHVPNSYPWLYHALAAWLELLPGGMVEVYWALQVFAVGSLALGTWLLARELGLRERPATWAVGFASLAAGVGWIWVHEPVAVVSSSRYGLVRVPPAQLRYRDVFSTIEGQGERAAETREIARGHVPAGIDWVVLPGAAPGGSLVKVTSCRVGDLHRSVDVQVYRPPSSG